MIKFKDITEDDKELIQSFTLWGERQNCDLSFSNLISWRFLYNTQFAIVDDYLVFRFYMGHHLAYMMPVPRPKRQDDGTFKVEPCDECSVSVIRAIRDDSIAMGHPFLMLGVCNYMRDIIEEHFPDTFDIKPDRDFSDYIYTRDKLINLSGKKLQSKRNHINKFKNLYPDYRYRELTPELIPQCLELERQWRRTSKDDNGDVPDEDLSEELRSMTRAFNRWDRLGLVGGTIFVCDKLVAFTFGCPINQCTFDVCVEKADVNYEGAFTIINQEFVKHLPEQYYYINREEDMGDEGLRRAKLSYKPDILLEKNVIMEKHPLAAFEDQDRIKEETREIWKQVFNDPDNFIDLYFSRVYRSEYNVCCQIDGKVVAALQTLPYTMLYDGREVKTVYVSGVSTRPEYRRQDIGNNLMRQAHFRIYYREIVFASLIPAEEWLYEWYEKCGYARVMTCTPPPADAMATPFEELDRIQRAKRCVLLHDEDGYEVIREDIRLAGDEYRPQAKNIQAMLRVINAKKALELYAELNPDKDMVLRVEGDADIPMNNAYYVIKNGKVRQTDEPYADALKLTINGLAEFLFDGIGAEMNLMLN
ncbi:GNAT family N-acetyltransferase [Xylanibacter rarus]|uniref:GNAT family N-acetyltransferase n=1 Tax=Xylanibacter rarus TaxID=1676614 RepID=UPI0035217F57